MKDSMNNLPSKYIALIALFAFLFSLAFSALADAAKGTDKGEVMLLTFQKGAPLAGVDVFYNEKQIGRTDSDGSLIFDLPAGEQKIQLKKGSQALTELTLIIESGEFAELIIPINQQAKVTQIIEESAKQSLVKKPETEDASEAATQLAGAAISDKPIAKIAGQVTSIETKAGIPNVNIYLSGIDQKVQTNSEGFFEIDIPEGNYTLSAVHSDFSAQTIKNIELAGKTKFAQNIEMTPAAEQLKEFVVVAPYLDGGVLALVEEKKKTSAVAEVISSEEVSKSGDSTAAAALSRVTGLTLVDGKYIYVRGMGDRYSSVRLNGSGLPSPEPSKSTIPLDMFPSGMIGSVLVQKTYSPNLPGNFGGGTVLIRTKPIPEEQTNKLTIGIGGNMRSTGKEGLTYEGGATDFLGVDDGTRELASRHINYLNSPEQKGSTADKEALDALARDLNNSYKTQAYTMMPDFDIKYTTSDRYEEYMGDSAWGYNFAVEYKAKERQAEDVREDIYLPEPGFSPELERKYKSKVSTNLSAMGSLIYEQGDNTKLESTTILSRATTDTVYLDTSYTSDNGTNFKEYGMQWEERQLLSQQFHGEHSFPDQDDLKLEWQGTASLASRYSPDTRSYQYKQNADYEQGETIYPYEYKYQGNGNTRTWEEMNDVATSLTIDLTQPVYDFHGTYGQLKAGLLYEAKERESDVYSLGWNTNRLRSTHPELLYTEDPADIFVDDNLGTGFSDIRLNNLTQATDSYTGSELFTAAYTMLDFTINPYLKIMTGLRYESSEQTIDTFEDLQRTTKKSNSLKDDFVLPALNITVPYREGEQLRFAYSQTINRPMLKELSESTYIDADTKDYYVGNPALQIAQIRHMDLRWEKYFNSYENLSFALFRKEFTDPIEVIALPSTDNDKNSYYTYSNVKEAVNQGVELQGRVWLKRLFGQSLSSFYIGFNGSIIDSEINLAGAQNNLSTNTKRALQGQAPWVANFNLGYQDLVKDIHANLLLNMVGDIIVKAGTKISPTAETGVDDTLLVSPVSLDFVYSQLVYEGAEDKLKVKFKVKNILDGTFQEVIGESIQKEYYKGTEFKVDFSYSWQ